MISNKPKLTILLPGGERLTAGAAIRRQNKKKREAAAKQKDKAA
jgi:hypothetical protein